MPAPATDARVEALLAGARALGGDDARADEAHRRAIAEGFGSVNAARFVMMAVALMLDPLDEQCRRAWARAEGDGLRALWAARGGWNNGTSYPRADESGAVFEFLIDPGGTGDGSGLA